MIEQFEALSLNPSPMTVGTPVRLWIDAAQQELVDFVKARVAPGRVFVISIARCYGSTTVLNKLRAEAPGLSAFFDREDEICEEAWSGGPFVIVLLDESAIVEERADYIGVYKSPTAERNTSLLFRVFMYRIKR